MKKNKRFTFIFKIRSFGFSLALLFIFGFSPQVNAQSNISCVTSDVNISTDSLRHKVNVQFAAGSTIYNLLVLVTDNVGYTIFLDSKYQFSGKYERSIDLKPGKYTLQVIRDENRISKKISIN